MYPKNEYLELIEKKIEDLNLKNIKNLLIAPILKF